MPSALCDYCSQPLDLESDETLFVRIDRRIDVDVPWDAFDPDVPAQPVLLGFDSQAHLAAWAAERSLPPVEVVAEEPWSFWDGVGCAVALVGAFALLLGAVFGFVQLVGSIF